MKTIITDLSKAVKLYEQTIRTGLACKMPWDRFNYLLSVRLFLEEWQTGRWGKRLVEQETVTLDWLKKETEELSGAFDVRNGNDFCQTYIGKKQLQMARLKSVYPGG